MPKKNAFDVFADAAVRAGAAKRIDAFGIEFPNGVTLRCEPFGAFVRFLCELPGDATAPQGDACAE